MGTHLIIHFCDGQVVMRRGDLGHQRVVRDVVVALVAREVPVLDHAAPCGAAQPPVEGREGEFSEHAACAVAVVDGLEAVCCCGGGVTD
jgi:hypothetical protein